MLTFTLLRDGDGVHGLTEYISEERGRTAFPKEKQDRKNSNPSNFETDDRILYLQKKPPTLQAYKKKRGRRIRIQIKPNFQNM